MNEYINLGKQGCRPLRGGVLGLGARVQLTPHLCGRSDTQRPALRLAEPAGKALPGQRRPRMRTS